MNTGHSIVPRQQFFRLSLSAVVSINDGDRVRICTIMEAPDYYCNNGKVTVNKIRIAIQLIGTLQSNGAAGKQLQRYHCR